MAKSGAISSDPTAVHDTLPTVAVTDRLIRALGRAGSTEGRGDELREAVSDFVAHEKARLREPEAVLSALKHHVRRGALLHTDHPAFSALVAHVFRMASEEYERKE